MRGAPYERAWSVNVKTPILFCKCLWLSFLSPVIFYACLFGFSMFSLFQLFLMLRNELRDVFLDRYIRVELCKTR